MWTQKNSQYQLDITCAPIRSMSFFDNDFDHVKQIMMEL